MPTRLRITNEIRNKRAMIAQWIATNDIQALQTYIKGTGYTAGKQLLAERDKYPDMKADEANAIAIRFAQINGFTGDYCQLIANIAMNYVINVVNEWLDMQETAQEQPLIG